MHLPLPVRHPAFDHAIELLRDGRVGEAGYGRRVALLLTIPTFDDPVARDIRRAATGELYVVRTVWQRAADPPFTRPPRRAVVQSSTDARVDACGGRCRRARLLARHARVDDGGLPRTAIRAAAR